MVSVPTGNADVAQTAVRDDESVTDVQPEIAEPFDVKPTVPVGVGGPAGPTVAVMVTFCPGAEGLGELVTVVVLAGRTTCTTVFEVLPASVTEP